MLTNSESWINITKQDIDELEKPDIHLFRKALESSASKVFMMLELGVIPVRFVLMKKRLQFLHYILSEPMDTMLRQVFEALKEDTRNGDVVSLTNRDKIELEIYITDEDQYAITARAFMQKYYCDKYTQCIF